MNLLFSYSIGDDFSLSGLGHTFLGAGVDKKGSEVHVFLKKEESTPESKNWSKANMPLGTPLGLCDTNGVEFRVGSVVRLATSINEEMHGDWVDYVITLQGTVPLLSYLYSEKGKVLPKGYTASPLSDFYDRKMFVFATDSMSLRPDEDLFIQDIAQKQRIKD